MNHSAQVRENGDSELMESRTRISAYGVVRDIRSHLGDDGLMVKYGLDQYSLETLFKKLLTLKLITHEELYRRSSLYKRRMDQIKRRLHPRVNLGVKVPIYDVTSGSVGLVRDISENGLRVAGFPVDMGHERTFQIPIDMFMSADPMLVIAECKWVTIKGRTRKYHVAGFELKDVSLTDRKLLKSLIEYLLFSKSGEWQVGTGIERELSMPAKKG